MQFGFDKRIELGDIEPIGVLDGKIMLPSCCEYGKQPMKMRCYPHAMNVVTKQRRKDTAIKQQNLSQMRDKDEIYSSFGRCHECITFTVQQSVVNWQQCAANIQLVLRWNAKGRWQL